MKTLIAVLLALSVITASAAPKFVLPSDVTVEFTITGDTQFTVEAPPLRTQYALQASSDGKTWFYTGFTFNASQGFQSASFSVYGAGALSFRLVRL